MKSALTAPDLWPFAQRMLVQIMYLIGAAQPAALACLSRRLRREALAWVSAAEAMVRKLLLIEAQALLLKPARARPKQRRPVTTRRPLEPKRAPVFALLPPSARERQSPLRIRPLGAPILVASIFAAHDRARRIAALGKAQKAAPHQRLANRINALARALGAPLRHARRLARALGQMCRRKLALLAHADMRFRTPAFPEGAFLRASLAAAAIVGPLNSS